MWSQDVTQAYLQSDDELKHEVYVKEQKKFGLNDDGVMLLLKPIYGLSTSGDYWDSIMTRHIMVYKGSFQYTLNITFFFNKQQNRKLHDICSMYVDDRIHAVTD